MDYRRLGSSGLKVSIVGLGGNNFGGAADEARSVSVIQRALDLGINMIDTADVYSTGVSEQYVGKAIAGRRQEAIVATKVNGKMGPGPNDRGLSRKHIIDGCEQSLRRLNTDYIDLYQVHAFDSETPLEETLGALHDLVVAGKVRYLGCSNFAAWQLVRALWFSSSRNWTSFVSVQPQYHLLGREIERELMPACSALGIGIIPYSPLAGGLLTGKYEAGKAPPADTRAARNPRMQQQLTTERLAVVEKLKGFAAERGYGVTQLAIAWLAAHPEVSTVIAGATRPEQVDDNARAAEVKLSAADMAAIDEIVQPA